MKRQFLKITYLAAVFFSCASFSFADTLPQPFDLQLLPEEVEKVFFSRLKDGKPLTLPLPTQKLPENMKAYDVWHGNRPYMKSSIEKVNLKFTKPADSEGSGGDFEVDFEFGPDGFVIKHSNTEYSKESGGFRVGNDRLDKVRKFLIRGKNKQSLVAFVPAYSPSEKSRGALLCPRDFFSKGTREEKASLQYSGYSLNNASGQVKAEMNAYLNNPIDFVLAEAKIMVTPGIKPAVNNYDRSYSKDASVALLYKPEEKAGIVNFPNYSNIAIGIENYLSLHFSTGYKRLSRQYALVFVKEISIADTMEVVLLAKDVIGTEMETELRLRKISLDNQGLISTKVKPGACYLVLYRVLPIIHEYLEETFVAPNE